MMKIKDGTVHAALQRWRDEDHEDTVALSREQVINLCEEYRAALPHMGGVRNEQLRAIQNSTLYQCSSCLDHYPEGSCYPADEVWALGDKVLCDGCLDNEADGDSAIRIDKALASHEPAPELPPVYPLVQPWETRPQGDDALDPSEIEIHEGSWAIVVGTNAKSAGWIDTHALFAHQVFLDRLAPRPAPEPAKDGPEVVERLRKWCSETINQWSDEYEPRENWERQVSGAMREWDKATTEIISDYEALRAENERLRKHLDERLIVERALRRRAETAEARNAELMEALEPFAVEAALWEGYDDAECLVESWSSGPISSINVSLLRRARAALNTKGGEGHGK